MNDLAVDQPARIPGLKMITDKGKNQQNTFTFYLDKKSSFCLRKLVQRHQINVQKLFHTAWGILLQKYNNSDDVLFAGIGMAGEKIAIHVKSDKNSTFLELLCNHQQIQADKHNFEHLVQVYDALSGDPPCCSSKNEIDASYDFHILVEWGDVLTIDIVYDPEKYDTYFLESLAQHLLNILRQVSENANQRVDHFEVLTMEEKEQLLVDFNQTNHSVPFKGSADVLFAEQARQTPDRLAVVSEIGNMTYRELNEKAECLASLLRNKGVDKQVIGVMMDNSPWMLVGILGVFKAGAAYMPIDPKYPQERIQYMLEDSGTGLLLSESQIDCSSLFTGEVWFIDQIVDKPYKVTDLLNQPNKPHDLAYVIYTSGSTGRPKGVMVEHCALINLIHWHIRYYQVTSEDRSTKYAGFGFDASVWEIFPYLVAGATLYTVPDHLRYDVESLNHFFEANNITISFLPTQIAEQFMSLENHSLRVLLTGGDRLRQVKKQTYRIVNNYGPTENTVVTTCCEVEEQMENIPIGSPIDQNQVYIVDRHDQLQPVGIPGELCISGASLARGYLNQEALTKEKFVSNPFCSSERIYRTGDLARWLPNGQIEFIGRMDQQVQVRGYRVELGEIEQRLLQHEQVQEAVVTTFSKQVGDTSLCAYVVINGQCQEMELRDYLEKKLPDYMLPNYWVKLDSIPVTANGKIDKKALPSPVCSMQKQTDYVAPTNSAERLLVKMWQEILYEDVIGIDDHFFQLGGHSLSAAKLVSRIRKRLGVKMTLADCFSYPTVRKMVRYLQSADTELEQPISHVQKSEYYPVSSEQQRMYVVQQLKNIGTTYHNPMVWEVTGKLNMRRLKIAIQAVINRHEALRASFHLVDGELKQKIHPEIKWKIEQIHADTGTDVKPLIKQMIRPFDLGKAPLFRVGLISIASDRQYLILDFHHTICDGVSMTRFLKEMEGFYQGKSIPFPDFQYKDYVSWQQEQGSSKNSKDSEMYWLKQFSEEVPLLDIPTDFPRPSLQTFTGERITFSLSQKLTTACKRLSSEQESTLYMVLLAVYYILLAKYTRQDALVVGSVVAGRYRLEWEQTVGMFVNTLPLKVNLRRKRSFHELLQHVKEVVLQAHKHGEYPFADLLERLDIHREPSRNPLFDTAFILQDTENFMIQIPGLQFHPYPYEQPQAMFDLTWEVFEKETIHFSVEYNTALFQSESIQRMVGHFIHILEQVVTQPEQPICEVDTVTEEERTQLLWQFNDTEQKMLPYPTVIHSFVEQAQKTPEKIAVVYSGRRMTYRELHEKSNQLARMLIKRNVNRGKIVSILMDASLDLFVAILGILKAGGAYLPIDPNYPLERIQYILEDSGCSLVLTSGQVHISSTFSGKVLEYAEEMFRGEGMGDLPIKFQPQDLAYIIYTSGSTGQPKGVMVEHQALLNLVSWHNQFYQVTDRDRSTKYAGLGFDASVWEIFPYFVAGATLYVVEDHVRQDIRALNDFFEKHGITISFLPTSIAEPFMILDNRSLRALLVGGDKLRQVRDNHYQIYNNYGPTENAVVTTCGLIDSYSGTFSIGRPIANNDVYILDEDQQLQPIGVPGELCISGASLARGYLNHEQLTKDKFVPNPFLAGERMYCTGDLARWLPNGTIEYLGRIDHQVKVRGYRIELGEIENRLLQHKAIREVIVLSQQDEDYHTSLCAYMVVQGKWSVDSLQKYLARFLPEYMIPHQFIALEKFPLTANGKLDRQALSAFQAPMKPESFYREPRNQTEILLSNIWSEVVGVERVGIDDNFFALGGDSIKAIQVAARLYQYGRKINISDLLQHPTVAESAPLVEWISLTNEPEMITGVVPLTPIQKWLFAQDIPNYDHWNQAVMISRKDPWNFHVVKQSLQKIMEVHDVLRMVFTEKQGEIRPFNREQESKFFSLDRFCLTDEKDPQVRMIAEANRLQRSVNIKQGPLVRVAIFETAEKHDLLFIIHHLVIDGVSWRIFIEDFLTAYRCTRQQKEIELPAKSHSFQLWAKELLRYANSRELLSELDYWRKQEELQVPKLIKERSQSLDCRLCDCQSMELSFSPEETASLLGEAHQTYHTEINDLLLAALAITLREWAYVDRMAIHLEGHGREPIIEGIEITRTMGWFTSVYPVIFELPSSKLSSVIKSVKETLRAVPHKGIGYGILKYLTDSSHLGDFRFQLQPEISFNYLGQFENEIQFAGIGSNAPLLGECFNAQTPVHPLEIYGVVLNQRLQLRFHFHPVAFPRAEMETFIDCYRHYLLEILKHCLQQGEIIWTPSDFSANELGVEELDQFLQKLDRENR